MPKPKKKKKVIGKLKVQSATGVGIYATRKEKPSGKKKFKNTQFGQRAMIGGKSFKNPDGTLSSVLTATSSFSDRVGRKGMPKTDIAIYPTIRLRKSGKLEKIPTGEAAREALTTGDFVRVKGGHTPRKIAKAQEKADRRSRKFSKKLGKMGRKKK